MQAMEEASRIAGLSVEINHNKEWPSCFVCWMQPLFIDCLSNLSSIYLLHLF